MSAPYGNEALHNVEDRGVNSGHRRASGKAMTRIQDDQATDRAEDLVSELKAIEFWDAVHKRNLFPFWYDQVAFESRQKRRAEITQELQRVSDRNGHASHPAPSPGPSESQSEGTIRVAKTRHSPQNSHDRYRGRQSETR
jgi:hypothetical protein